MGRALVKRSAGKISSLMELAQGKLPKQMLEDFCDPDTGLFPKPKEIHFGCSCPDGASCCKHVAAVLYGVGARLDENPGLFFTLRGIDPNSIVAAEVVDALTGETENELDGADLGDVFGIAFDAEAPSEADAPVQAKAPAKAKTRKSAARPAAGTAQNDALAARVKALRVKMGLSQAVFGKKIGTQQAIVSLMERGKAPSQISKALPAIRRLEKKFGLAR